MPVGAEQSRQADPQQGRRRRQGEGQALSDGDDLTFDPKGGGSHRGLWAEGSLTWMLTLPSGGCYREVRGEPRAAGDRLQLTKERCGGSRPPATLTQLVIRHGQVVVHPRF